jgi:hypothetical protein
MTLQLKEGGYYLDKEGDVVGPLQKHRGHAIYCWIGIYRNGNNGLFTDKGSFSKVGVSAADLIQECTPDGTPIQEKAMTKYDETKVDALIEAVLAGEKAIEEGKADVIYFDKWERMKKAADALRPKPAKFHTMPTWEEFIKGKNATNYMISLETLPKCSTSISKTDYNALREAQASEKPLVHIPAGSDWSDDDLAKLWDGNIGQSFCRPMIDRIKAKLESQ